MSGGFVVTRYRDHRDTVTAYFRCECGAWGNTTTATRDDADWHVRLLNESHELKCPARNANGGVA